MAPRFHPSRTWISTERKERAMICETYTIIFSFCFAIARMRSCELRFATICYYLSRLARICSAFVVVLRWCVFLRLPCMCFALLELVLLSPALPCFCVASLSICFAVLRCALRCVALPFASCLLSFGLICLAFPCLALLRIALFAFDEFHSVALCIALLDFAWLRIML